MDLSAMARRLLRLARREPADQRGVDAADMGTAFGLEASLLDSEQYEEDDSRWRTPVPTSLRSR
jgi:hypothetical protein